MTEHLAYHLARDLMSQLSPGCNRIAVAGSIRRGKPVPGDIEIVCVPSLGQYELKDMFGFVTAVHPINRLDETLASLLMDGAWAFGATTKRNGEKYKRLKNIATGIACDLFITDTRRWGYTFAVRTGPAEFGHALVTRALNRSCFFKDGLFHNHSPQFEMKDGKRVTLPCPSGDRCLRIIETPEEPAIFDVLHLPYIAPENRSQANFSAIAQG